MDRNDLLGTTFTCQCGKEHVVPTRELIFAKDCIALIGDSVLATVGSDKKLLIVADNRTFSAAGEAVEKALLERSFHVSSFILADTHGESPVADELTKDLMLRTAPSADLYIAVGSGVVNDLVKWIAFLRNTPYIAVPTAASMNGYASANVAATIHGLKVLIHAKPAEAVIVDPAVLYSAPYELTTSGLGDVLAKSVSSADWKLNHFLFDEYYCQFSVDLLKELEPVYLENPVNIKNKEPKALRALFEALFYSSIAMTITGTSSPASGGEHLISHTLDMLADRDGRKHDLHGRQVGVASILMAALYDRVMHIETPVFHPFPKGINEQFWGKLTPVVEEQYHKKQAKFNRAVEILSDPTNWLKLKENISPGLVSPSTLKACLQRADGAHRFNQIRDNRQPLSKENFLEVVNNANQMRERFTILDLAILLGIIPNETETLVSQWVSV